MRARLGLILATMTATTVATTVAIAALGAGAQAATVDKQRFKGKQVAVEFSATVSITCADGSTGSVSASGFLSGANQISKETGTPKSVSNGTFVEVDGYTNSCTGASLPFGDGGIDGGFTPPNKKLNSAELAGSTTVQDLNTGRTFPVSIDVIVEGTGPLTAGKSHARSRTVVTPGGPVTITITDSSNANREGTASGSVTIDGVELDPTFSSVTLSDDANTEITITKP
jgi:hypothetical protein